MISLICRLVFFSFKDVKHIEVSLVFEVQKWFDEIYVVYHTTKIQKIIKTKNPHLFQDEGVGLTGKELL
jgi:hypothetical protein